ncbi:MAG: trypsin-like serine protease [Acidobacteria bacterium]|nr:trypsin-like serine protease [Acidobacteriota bacterium]
MSDNRAKFLLFPLALGLVLGLGFFVGLGLTRSGDAAAREEPAPERATAAVTVEPPADGPVDSAPIESEASPVSATEQQVAPAPIGGFPDGRERLTMAERSTIEMFESLSPSVVFVTSIAERRDFFSMPIGEYEAGRGSGFVWDKDGHIVTNFHVVASATAGLKVTLANQTVLDADIVGMAPEKDLAVLRVYHDPTELEPIPVGRSDDLLVGQNVLAIGNPFGLDQTLTTGISSALGRTIASADNDSDINDVIQTDAAINPGNSGGPLIDSSGRLIGVNTAIASPSGAYAGVGFAIPVDTVRWVVPDLIQHGRVQRPSLGFTHWDISVNRRYNFAGVMVRTVTPEGSASTAGLQGTYRDERGRVVFGDVVTSVAGQPVGTPGDLLLVLESLEIGETVRVTYMRQRREYTTEIELVEQ